MLPGPTILIHPRNVLQEIASPGTPIVFKNNSDDPIDNPDLALVGVTFGWLEATFNSIQNIMADGYLEGIATPLLIISSGADEIVSVAAQKKACRRLPECDMVMIPNALHELLIETDAVLENFWETFDAFIFRPSPAR